MTTPGDPINWGTGTGVPNDFGLAVGSSTIPFELDKDKISRLNNMNNYSLSSYDIAKAAKLNNVDLGIKVTQVMSINIEQASKSAVGNNTFFTFAILTSIDSKPVSASLNCYALVDNYLINVANNTSDIGVGYVTIQVPSSVANSSLFIVFARASFDDRITSYAIYNFLNSTQEIVPSDNTLALTPLNDTLNFTPNYPNSTTYSGYVFSYTCQQNLTIIQGTNQVEMPIIIDKSPIVIVVRGLQNSTYFQDWTSYPQVPLNAGSSFENSEQNVFGYLVTINGVLYNVDISLGDAVP